MNGKTPNQVANAWTAPLNRISDERALDALLYEPAGERVVGKKGLRLNNQYYIASALAGYIGVSVRVKLDERDVGVIYVYELDAAFICRAECPALLGTSPAEVATVTKKAQRKLLAAQRQEYKDHMRRMKTDMADVILQHRIEQSQNVTELPRPFESYSTAALQAAGEAARSNDGPEYTPTDTSDRAQFIADFQQAKPTVTEFNDDPRARYRRWARIERRIAAGEPVDTADRNGLKSYQSSGEYENMKQIFEDFGLPIDEPSESAGFAR